MEAFEPTRVELNDMVRTAYVGGQHGRFRADLSDGSSLFGCDLNELAAVLWRNGFGPEQLSFGLRGGRLMLTSGQEVALCSELRRLLSVSAQSYSYSGDLFAQPGASFGFASNSLASFRNDDKG